MSEEVAKQLTFDDRAQSPGYRRWLKLAWVAAIAAGAAFMALHDTLWVTASVFDQFGLIMFGLSLFAFFAVEMLGYRENLDDNLGHIWRMMRAYWQREQPVRQRLFRGMGALTGLVLAFFFQRYLFRTSFMQITALLKVHHFFYLPLTLGAVSTLIVLAAWLSAILFWSQWLQAIHYLHQTTTDRRNTLRINTVTWRRDMLWFMGYHIGAESSYFSFSRGVWRLSLLGISLTFGMLSAFVGTSTLITGYLKYQAVTSTIYHMPHHGPDVLLFCVMLFLACRTMIKLARLFGEVTDYCVSRGARNTASDLWGKVKTLSPLQRLVIAMLLPAYAFRALARSELAAHLATDPFSLDRRVVATVGSLSGDATSAWSEKYIEKTVAGYTPEPKPVKAC